MDGNRIWESIAAGAGLALILTGSAAATPLDILSYNVRGLPSPPIEDRTSQIGGIAPKIEAFHVPVGNAIVGLQELFDPGYYATITTGSTYSSITAKANDGPSFIGDGLTTMSDFTINSYDRVQWGTNATFSPGCFGTGGANGSDCDTNKGFARARVDLDPGAGEFLLDVYNLHADAGQDGDASNGSIGARQNNINELAAYINANSVGTAVIVMGDTNSLFTSSSDIIGSLLTLTGVSDVWVEEANGAVIPGFGSPLNSSCPPPRGTAMGMDVDASGPNCELVDKILYRGSSDVQLTPMSYAVLDALFVDTNGDPLSDHLAVSTRFDFVLVPEPATAIHLLAGFVGLSLYARRARRTPGSGAA